MPAFVLAALITTSLAFGMALAIPSPLVTNVIVNALIFVILLFSPVVYPITQLPGWLADVHRVLPIYHLAQVLRASITNGLVHDVASVMRSWLAGRSPHGPRRPGHNRPPQIDSMRRAARDLRPCRQAGGRAAWTENADGSEEVGRMCGPRSA